ncbi:hypothetical protein C8R45DRAFT_1094860 [Mycena sanguinolenta]|nr:hypothetical protein C8R45DRAFT_1094860 [Mycena sanguinolenta]
MSSECALSEPRLPPELEHRIFHIAALAHPRWIPALMLLARRIKFCVEPILYRVVLLTAPSADTLQEQDNLGLPTFARDAVEKRSHNLRHVKHLLIDGGFVQEKLQSWLLAYTGVTNLYARDPSFTQCLHQYPISHNRCPCTLCHHHPGPLFLTVTHLELLVFDELLTCEQENVASICRNISLIPRLTHIALNLPPDSLLLHAALCANTRLQCIVFLSSRPHESPLMNDDRFVAIHEAVPYDLDWLHGAMFRKDFWSLADDFLAEKRAGTIDLSQYRIRHGGNFDFIKLMDND